MNYILPIIIGLVINGVLGTIWYGPLFGNQWMKIKNLKQEDLKGGESSMIFILFTSFLGLLLFAYLHNWLGIDSMINNIKLGLIMASFGSLLGFNTVVYDRPGGMMNRFKDWFLYLGFTIVTLGLTSIAFGLLI